MTLNQIHGNGITLLVLKGMLFPNKSLICLRTRIMGHRKGSIVPYAAEDQKILHIIILQLGHRTELNNGLLPQLDNETIFNGQVL